MIIRELAVKLGMTGNAGDKLAKFGLQMGGARAALDLFTGAFKAAKSVVFDFTADLAKRGDDIAKTAKKIGLTAEALQELSFAAQISGSDVTKITKAVQTMSKNLNDARIKGTGPFLDSLDQLGLKVEEFDGLGPDEVFERVADEIAKLEDPITQSAIAADIFGRSGKELLPLFREGGEGIRALREEFTELGGGFTEDGAAAAEEFIDAQTRLNTVIDSIKIAIGTELFPVIQELIDSIRGWFQANKDLIRQRLIEIVRKLITEAKRLTPILADLFNKFIEFLPTAVEWAEALATLIEKMGGLEGALKIAAGAWIGFQLATTAALGPVGLIAGAFALLLPIALELGDTLGDVAFEISEVGKEAARLDKLNKGRTKFRGSKGRLLAAESKAGTSSDVRALKQLDEVEFQAFEREAKRSGTKTAKSIVSEEKTRRDITKQITGVVNNASEIAQRGIDQKERAAETKRQRRSAARAKAGRKKGKDGIISREEALKLISQAGATGENLGDLLQGRKLEGGPPPVITVTINRTDVKQQVNAPVTVTGVPGDSAEEVAQMVEEKQRELLKEEYTRAIQDLQTVTAR